MPTSETRQHTSRLDSHHSPRPSAASGEVAPEALAQRRMQALHSLVTATDAARSLQECLDAAARALADSALSLPFLLGYTLDEARRGARLTAHSGLGPGTEASPELLDLGAPCRWPLSQALASGRPLVLEDVAQRFPALKCGAGDEPVEAACLLPIHCSSAGACALLIMGASPRHPLDDTYHAFCDLLCAVLSGAIAKATRQDSERRQVAALAEIDQAKVAFFSNISHDFRTPLSLILGPLEDELAEADPLPPGRHARLQTAQRNGMRLLRMVNTLLDFSHIEAGHMQGAFEPVDLVAVTEELTNLFRAPIEQAGLRLSTRLEALPEPVFVDREMWTKIVLNMLSNALKHTFKGGITVSLFASDQSSEHVELRVDDTGTGIPAKQLPKLFQRFHRVRGARSRSDEGTGIGLALIRAFATLHGGEVSVVSREGLGSSFRVRLRRGAAHLPADRIVTSPRWEAGDHDHAGAYVEEALQWSKPSGDAPEQLGTDSSPAVGGDAPAPVPSKHARILLADGNLDMRNYLARLLSRSYDVSAVSDAQSALQAALDSPPDLIMLDVTLPGRDGFELLKELRATQRTRLVPVIMLSARAGEDSALEALEAGADDYLVKPFSGKALLARVRSCLALAKLRKESADKLAEANKELEAFSYSVSHDLRAPLRAIDGFSKALLREYSERLDDQGRHYLGRVRHGTQRMAELIDDLLSLSRITRGPIRHERVDLSEISRKILQDLQERDPQRAVAWRVGDGLIGRGDSRLMTVLLENLLGNAWKFTAKRSPASIEVGVDLRAGEKVFFVRDDGAGFEMAYAAKLFAPFVRLHSDAEYQGTGIGLATVHRVITRHGGRIWAEAAPGAGASFFFTLGAQA